MEAKTNLVIGIGGISRSGKSSLAELLRKHYNCPVISNDTYFVNAVTEWDPEVMPDKFKHWESSVSCDLQGYYNGLLDLALKPNDARMVIAEGHLLYYRQDVVNLLDVKIMRTMSKEGAYNRLKKLRPRLIKGEKWYDKVMWQQFLAQNEIFSEKLPDSYAISGELDPEIVFKEVTKIIDGYKAKGHNNMIVSKLKAIPMIVQTEGKPCCVCATTKEDNNLYQYSCGHWFHRKCFEEIFNTFLGNALETREGRLKCPKCGKEIDEYFIQKLGNLHDYKKALLSDNTPYKCVECGRIHWSLKDYCLVLYTCTGCLHFNEHKQYV